MEKLRYAVYMRKSTEEAERQVLSLASQEDQIKSKFGNLEIVAWYRESKSAFEPDKRIQFKEMLGRIDSGEINGVIAWHPDRLSRNEVDASALTWRIRQSKITDLKFASGFNFDPTPESMMMLQMTMSQSQYFSAKLSKDVKRGNEKKREMGGLTGRAPEGYLNKRTSTAGRGEAVVIKDPERFNLIRKAFDMFLTGEHSLQSIHKIMTDEWGYRTLKRNKTGGGPIAKASIYKIFRNIRYAGLVPDPYIPNKYYDANFPAMITLEEYERVQQLLGRSGLPRNTSKKEFALRGFMHCGDCGCSITAQTKTKKLANGSTSSYTYYHCTGRRKGCSQKSVYVKEEVLYDQLIDLLDKYELCPEMYEWAMDALRGYVETESGEREQVQNMQDRSIKDLQSQLDKLLDMATRGLIDDDVYLNKSTLLNEQMSKLLELKVDTSERTKNWYEIVTDTFVKLTDANDKFSNGSTNDKRSILLAIGQNPTLLDGQLHITPNEWLVPVSNSAKHIRKEIETVRTMPQQTQKASEEAISLQWCTILNEVRTIQLRYTTI